jgi:flavin reductase (DIM6/NTAB) family NADH-FMN oxidoreductase RutF
MALQVAYDQAPVSRRHADDGLTMFLDPRTATLNRGIFNAIVAPRPIGWISSCSAAGHINLAPFSHFNIVSTAPPVILFSCNTPGDRAEKDTLANVRATGEFVYNLATYDLREAVNKTSTAAAPDIDEFEIAGLEKADCVNVRPPRVAASPANLECRLLRIVEIEPEQPGDTSSNVVFGRVIGMHIQDDFMLPGGRFDTTKAQPLTRLGGIQYAAPGPIFEMPAPFRRVGE